MQMPGFTDHEARRWGPERSRLRIFSIVGMMAAHARRTRLRLSANAPWADLIITALTHLAALPAPARPHAIKTPPRRDITLAP